jgi:hypothetical protein
VEWVFDCCESKRKETKERRRRKSQDGANQKNTIDWEKEEMKMMETRVISWS